MSKITIETEVLAAAFAAFLHNLSQKETKNVANVTENEPKNQFAADAVSMSNWASRSEKDSYQSAMEKAIGEVNARYKSE